MLPDGDLKNVAAWATPPPSSPEAQKAAAKAVASLDLRAKPFIGGGTLAAELNPPHAPSRIRT